MSLLFRSRPEPAPVDRSLTVPFMPTLPSFADVGDVSRGETSLQSIALRSTADLIASLTSELPVNVYRNGRRVSGVPENLDDPGGDGMGREDWLYRLVMSWLLRGNAYGFANGFDALGRAKSVDLLHPDDVTASVVDGSPSWYFRGRKLSGADLANFTHYRVNPVAGRLQGLSPVASHASTIGVTLATTQFGRQWFSDGAHPSGVLANTKTLSRDQAKTAKDRFVAALRGTREPVVLGGDWSWKPIQVNPEESQFLETINATEAQCARMFGPGFAEVMGYESGGSMTYANVVDRRQDLLVFSMSKWLRRADRVLTKLLPPSTLAVRLERDALLETTTLQRYQAHALALGNDWRTVNEIRQIEDLPPLPWGDQRPSEGGTGGQPAQS